MAPASARARGDLAATDLRLTLVGAAMVIRWKLVRDECLNSRWFESVDDARQTLQYWRRDDSEVRLHSSLGDFPPAAFAAQIQSVAPELCSQGGEEERQAGPTKGSGSRQSVAAIV